MSSEETFNFGIDSESDPPVDTVLFKDPEHAALFRAIKATYKPLERRVRKMENRFVFGAGAIAMIVVVLGIVARIAAVKH